MRDSGKLPGQSQYLLYKVPKTSDYRTATHITIKEKFVSYRVKNTDTCILKKLLQQPNKITKERQSHSTSGNKTITQWSFPFLLSQFCPHTYQPQHGVQARKRNHRVLITATPAFLGAHRIILWSPIDQQEIRKAQLLPDSLHRKENNQVHE